MIPMIRLNVDHCALVINVTSKVTALPVQTTPLGQTAVSAKSDSIVLSISLSLHHVSHARSVAVASLSKYTFFLNDVFVGSIAHASPMPLSHYSVSKECSADSTSPDGYRCRCEVRGDGRLLDEFCDLCKTEEVPPPEAKCEERSELLNPCNPLGTESITSNEICNCKVRWASVTYPHSLYFK